MRTIIFVFLCALPLPAMSAEWTAGFTLGVSDTGDYCAQFEDVTCDKDTSPAFRVFLGQNITRHFRVEGFAADLGSSRIEDNLNPPDSGTLSIGGLGVVAMPLLPLGNGIEAFAKVGIFRSWIGEHRIERVSFMFRSDADNPVYGLGMRWGRMRMDWDHYDITARTNIGIDTFTIGGMFEF